MNENKFRHMILKVLKLLSTLLIALVFCKFGNAQAVTFNDGFEGKKYSGVLPIHWYNCNDGLSTVDIQPGAYNNQREPSQGETYISLVTRKDGQPGTVETVWAFFLPILKKDKCYNINLDLSLSNEYHFDDFGDIYYFNSPCILQVIGFNGDCKNPSETEILWESNPLENFNWETFDITLSPTMATYEKIAFRPYFTPANNHQNSVLFIDNLRFNNTNIDFIENNGEIELPEGSTDIEWYFNGKLVQGANSINMPVMGTGKYKAIFYSPSGCYSILERDFYINLSEINIYPNPTSSIITIDKYSLSEDACNFSVYDELGKLVLEREIMQIKGTNKMILDLSALAPAVYFLKIVTSDREFDMHKIVLGK